MGIEIFARVKDGSLPRVTKTEHNCNIKFTYQKNKTIKKNRIIEDFMIVESSENLDCFDLARTSRSFQTKVYGIKISFHNEVEKKTMIVCCIIDDLIKMKREKDVDNPMKKFNKITVSAYQIYCEKMYDMLNNNKQLKVFKTNKLIINDLTVKNIENREQIIKIIEKNRKMAATNMNEVSSRSHAIIIICYGGKKYTFIDMAGQESGVTSSKNEKNVKKQGTAINLNMLALKEFIRLHHAKSNHIPFRRTLLTLALKPMFTTHCYVAFICTIGAKQKLFYQLDSIRYASALYNKDNLKKDLKIKELFKKYTDYVEESGWIACRERELWMKMKGGNIGEFTKIFGYMRKRSKLILGLSKTSLKYKKILPSIPKFNKKEIEKTEEKYFGEERNVKLLKPLDKDDKPNNNVKKREKINKKIQRYNELKPIKEESKKRKNIINKYKKNLYYNIMPEFVCPEELTRNEYLELLKHNDSYIFIKFGAEWCAPCNKIKILSKKNVMNYLIQLNVMISMLMKTSMYMHI